MSCFCAGLPAAEACSRAAGAIGRVWRQRRRDLPPDVRDLIAETLLALRIYVLPDTMLDAAGAIGRSRYDIRGISEMLKHLATRDEWCSGDGIAPLIMQPRVAPSAAVSADPFTTVFDFIGTWKPLVASSPTSVSHVGPEDVLPTVCVPGMPQHNTVYCAQTLMVESLHVPVLDMALSSAHDLPATNADIAATHVSGSAMQSPLAMEFFELLEQDAQAILSQRFPAGADSGAG